MTLKEFYEQLQGLEQFELRSATETLVDVVFEAKDASAWQERLEALLGPALKPAGQGPNGQVKKIAKALGGIRNEQTLFCKTFGDLSLAAVFWPWQNGRCTTCKAFFINSVL
jgi:hypothetical protein